MPTNSAAWGRSTLELGEGIKWTSVGLVFEWQLTVVAPLWQLSGSLVARLSDRDEARSGHVAKQLQDRDYWDAGLAARSLFLLSATKLWPPSPLTISNSPVASKSAGKFLAP